ncbi:ATP-binding cassette domain-containing protein [Nocardioides sp. zg-ZUI104]|uniref:ABC transporter ATP-binding protein n=1 Tax=Nocardioides faecalis TaxID=2803858 RepID=UPI001BCCF83D|nr:ATP-binding cassette domain-containing protein [Nocardioides faecalis]MBS4751941.1 ATP-binding cassette domain-containing protein [Nocardioides faecalis]
MTAADSQDRAADRIGAEPLLVGTGLQKRYGGVVAVDDVSLVVHPGEILGLVGPNGAGKTTLVDIITGAQSADGGELVLAGRQLGGSAARRGRQGLARTFQHPLLPAECTVLEAVVAGLVANRMPDPLRMLGQLLSSPFRRTRSDYDAAARVAEELGLTALDRQCGELSLGEQRLVEVVRALAQDPRVMLLDEPFAGADHAGIAGTIEAVRTIQRRGQGVILVDHNVDLIADLADRVVLLDRGRIVFEGLPADCLSSREMQDVYFGGGAG